MTNCAYSVDIKVIASDGQGDTHAPQAVQAAKSICGLGTCPTAMIKLIARGSQASLQLWHHTPFAVKQVSLMFATRDQGRSVLVSKTGSGHTSTHCLQNVHSSWLKSISGNPPAPRLIILVSQASIHLSQRVQLSVKLCSGLLQGGRITWVLRRLNRLRRLWLIPWVIIFPIGFMICCS